MRKLIVSLICAALVPCMASALTTAELQAQIDALLAQLGLLQGQSVQTQDTAAATSTTCPTLTRTLSRGSEGGDVRQLQAWLRERKFLNVEPTGFYGPLTEKAVQEFQRYERIVFTGNPATTGWGVVGPKTRSAIAKLCAFKTAAVPDPKPKPKPEETACPSVSATPPTTSCAGIWEKLQNAKGCHIGWKCMVAVVPSTKNQPPIIHSVDGPSSVNVGKYGTWRISASDPEGGSLSYAVAWGDEDVTSLLNILAGTESAPFGSSPSATHYFARAGKFSPEFMVRDAAGNVRRASLTVTVVDNEDGTPPIGGDDDPPPATGNACMYAGALYSEGTETQGRSINDLCLTTGGTCQPPAAYLPKFKCSEGAWVSTLTNPYPNLPPYGNVVGTTCSSNGATREVVVSPNTQLCRDLLCAISQNYAKVSLTCQYTNWIDYGLFRNSATSTSICAEPTPCEYSFGDQGRACAAKQNGRCPTPSSGNPSGL